MRIRTLLGGILLALTLVLVAAGPALAQEEEGGSETAEAEGHAGPKGHAEEECIELLEEGSEIDACQEAPNPILPEVNELIWGGISFLLLFLLLAKFGFPAVKQGMNARTERIRSSIDEADQAKAEAQTILEDYQRQLADARNEAARIIEEARQTADNLRKEQETRLQAELDEMRERATEQNRLASERVMTEVGDQVKALAIELAEKVVEANLDRDANLRIIENYINSVGQQGATR
jgi:F-type H+-transporting ATPase subunit b